MSSTASQAGQQQQDVDRLAAAEARAAQAEAAAASLRQRIEDSSGTHSPTCPAVCGAELGDRCCDASGFFDWFVTVIFVAAVDGLRAELQAAAAEAEAARSAAAKAEADMEDLASAFQVHCCPATHADAVETRYRGAGSCIFQLEKCLEPARSAVPRPLQGLESHAGQLEAELRQARARAGPSPPGAANSVAAGTPLAAGCSAHFVSSAIAV